MSSSKSQKLERVAGDEELMLAARAGDLHAFEALVLRHQSAAWSAAHRFLGDAREAEDIVQEAFLRIWKNAARYEPSARFRTYLYRVVTRLCLDHAARKRPRYGRDLAEPLDAAPTALDRLSQEESEAEVRDALDGLPPNQRMAVLLRYYEGLGYAEIAAALETSAKAVERLLARARAQLESRLAHQMAP